MSRERKIKSFDRFTDELQRLSPERISIEAFRRVDRRGMPMGFTTNISAVGELGNFTHGLLYGVQLAKRERAYSESLFAAFQSTFGIADREKRAERAMAVLLAGEIRRDQLSILLPDTEVYLAGPDKKPMGEEELVHLHQDAHRHGVMPPDLRT